jgi:hypothetical protein
VVPDINTIRRHVNHKFTYAARMPEKYSAICRDVKNHPDREPGSNADREYFPDMYPVLTHPTKKHN